MPTVSPQNRLERVVPALLGLTVLAFAGGSSSVHSVTHVAHAARWGVLVVLFAAAGAWAGPRAVREAPPRMLIGGGALVGLAALSALWSVDPKLTVERAVSLGLLLATALLLAVAARAQAGRSELVALGLLGGMVAVAVAGLVVLALAHDRAVVPASIEVPVRYQGLGQNPNTAALVLALGIPLGIWAFVRARTTRARLVAGAVVVLLAGSIVASGSRGSLLAAFAGATIPAVAWATTLRGRVLAVVAVAAVAAVCALVQQLPQPVPIGAPPPATGHKTRAPAPRPRYINAEKAYPLAADVGGPLPGGGQPTVQRSFLSSSGRVEAWKGALRQAEQRPLLGYGFGTETKVFVDRYYTFVAGLPENSYIGLALQLGAIGVLALLALVGALVLPARRALAGPQRTLVAACVGAVLAGLVLAGVQSYLYSVGNIAAASFWICAFLVPAVAHD